MKTKKDIKKLGEILKEKRKEKGLSLPETPTPKGVGFSHFKL